MSLSENLVDVLHVPQNGISDAESHSIAEKILMQMGEFFQIQVVHRYMVCLINVLVCGCSGLMAE